MLTFLNNMFQENRDSYTRIKEELDSLQSEVNSIKVKKAYVIFHFEYCIIWF